MSLLLESVGTYAWDKNTSSTFALKMQWGLSEGRGEGYLRDKVMPPSTPTTPTTLLLYPPREKSSLSSRQKASLLPFAIGEQAVPCAENLSTFCFNTCSILCELDCCHAAMLEGRCLSMPGK